MSDWQVGDLAVCVDASPVRSFPQRLVQGATYTVTEVHWAHCPHYGWGCGLMFAEVEPLTSDGFWSLRFRKIHPDKHEACEDEFITLLKRRKSPAQHEHIMDGLGDD